MSEPERRTSWTVVLVGLILLLVAMTMALSPFVECPLIPVEIHLAKKGADPAMIHSEHSCEMCGGRGRISYLKLWALKVHLIEKLSLCSSASSCSSGWRWFSRRLSLSLIAQTAPYT